MRNKACLSFFMDKQPYIHPFLSYDALAAQLAQRGVAGEPAFITRKLMEVGYQRLSAYWLPFSDALNSFVDGAAIPLAGASIMEIGLEE